MRSDRCGIIARKLNPHRVFIPVPNAYSIVSAQCDPHMGHRTCKRSARSPGGGLPRFDVLALPPSGMLPSRPRLHFWHSTGLFAFETAATSYTTINNIYLL